MAALLLPVYNLGFRYRPHPLDGTQKVSADEKEISFVCLSMQASAKEAGKRAILQFYKKSPLRKGFLLSQRASWQTGSYLFLLFVKT